MKYAMLLALALVAGCESPDAAVVNSRDCHRLLALSQTASDTALVRGIRSVRDGAFPCYMYIDALTEAR